jgi:hypothetical protein
MAVAGVGGFRRRVEVDMELVCGNISNQVGYVSQDALRILLDPKIRFIFGWIGGVGRAF